MSVNPAKKKEIVLNISQQKEIFIFREIIDKLFANEKSISSKYFYDDEGSALFEEICRLPEYYPTRTEISILNQIAPGLMKRNSFSDIVELGCGENLKIDVLLKSIPKARRNETVYHPIDISKKVISDILTSLKAKYPEIETKGLVRDFMTKMLDLPASKKKLFCFFGSTIGNLSQQESNDFLSKIAKQMSQDDHFILGFDNVKDKKILEQAYNDNQGVTERFNKNILKVVNAKIGSNFDPLNFDHHAFFNNEKSRIEMHLVARETQNVWINSIGRELTIQKGENIHTENSRKYSRNTIRQLAISSGLKVVQWHTDPNEWFTVAELRKAE